MLEMNGSQSPSFPDGSGTSTPVAAEQTANRQVSNNESSAKHSILSSVSNLQKNSKASNSGKQQTEGDAPRSKKIAPERSSERLAKVDTDVSKHKRAGDEEVTPKGLPTRRRTKSGVEGAGRASRKDKDDSEAQPIPVEEDPRSSSVVRTGTFADGTNFVSASNSEQRNERDVGEKARRESVAFPKQERDK